MRIVIASGKGGTGKTTLATNLAVLAAQAGLTVAYVDCNVEGPNGHIFLKPELREAEAIYKRIPCWNEGKCAFCGKCRSFCQCQAIICVDWQVLVNPKQCQACGGCLAVCSHDALMEQMVEIGCVQRGTAGPIQFIEGRLRNGEAQSAPLIRALKAAIPPADLVLLDAPHGNSSPIVETARDTDFLVVVTESTPFGLEDLQRTAMMAGELNLRAGVIINRVQVGRTGVRQFCQDRRLPILAEIPDDFSIVEVCAEGKLVLDELPGYRRILSSILRGIAQAAGPAAWREKMATALDLMNRVPAKNNAGIATTVNESRSLCYLAFRAQKSAEP